MLLEFFLDLSLFGDFVSVLLNPFCNLYCPTDRLIRNHLYWQFDNFDIGLLYYEKNFSFVF